MKKLLIIFFLICFQQLSFAVANTNISIIDLNKVLEISNPGASILKQLKTQNDKILKNFEIENKKLNEKETKLISQKNILSKKDFEIKVNELRLEIDSFNKSRKNIFLDFKKLKINNTNKLLEMINVIIMKYSEENNISIILQKKKVVIGKSELEITDEIIKIINNEIKEFKIK